MKGDNIKATFRKVALQSHRIKIEADVEGVLFDVRAQDSVIFTHLSVPISHRQMGQFVGQWFVHLPRGEQMKLIQEMQKIVDQHDTLGNKSSEEQKALLENFRIEIQQGPGMA